MQRSFSIVLRGKECFQDDKDEIFFFSRGVFQLSRRAVSN